MTFSNILAILGLAFTVFLGVPGVYVLVRNRYPGRITFVLDSSIGLFDSVVKNRRNLDVLYRGEQVEENLVLLRGYIINSGSCDITKDMTGSPLTIHLPEGYKWLSEEVEVIDKSQGVVATLKIVGESANSLEIGCDLLKKNEFIKFESLVEAQPRENSEQHLDDVGTIVGYSLEFTHRIANTGRVKGQDRDSAIESRHDLRRVVSVLAVTTLMLGLMFNPIVFPFLSQITEPNKINYLIETEDKGFVEVEVSPRKNGMIQLDGVDNEFELRLSEQEFLEENRKWQQIVSNNTSTPSPSTWLWMLLLIVGVGSFILYSWLVLSKDRYENILNIGNSSGKNVVREFVNDLFYALGFRA